MSFTTAATPLRVRGMEAGQTLQYAQVRYFSKLWTEKVHLWDINKKCKTNYAKNFVWLFNTNYFLSCFSFCHKPKSSSPNRTERMGHVWPSVRFLTWNTLLHTALLFSQYIFTVSLSIPLFSKVLLMGIMLETAQHHQSKCHKVRVMFVFLPDADTLPEENCTNSYHKILRWFKQNMCSLQVVPINIPAEAMRVYLQDNVISLLPPWIFSNLSECQSLHLERNEISSVEKGSFVGLTDLQNLFLDWNPIVHISEGSFDSLHSIRMIGLKNILLTSLHPNLFVNLPRHPMNLALSGPSNNWKCSSLCWLKFEEIHQTVVWDSGDFPTCGDGEDWKFLVCGDPGESEKD